MSHLNKTPTKLIGQDNGKPSGRRTLFPKEDTPKGQDWLTRKITGKLDIHSPPVLQQPDIIGQNFVNFVTILGPARQGKSFLINCLIGKDVFETADTMGVCTKGVKISSIVHKANDDGSFLFVDTEGQGDEDVDSDVTLLTPVLLLSKVILFNWKGGLQKNKILDELAILVEVANSVSSKNLNDDSPTFGHLNVVLRDFHFDGTAEEAFNKIFTEEKQRGEKIRDRNKLREKLLSSFESIRVFIVPPPGDEIKNLRLCDTDEAFQKSLDELKENVWSQTNKPRYFGSTVVDSKNAGILVRKFAEVLEAGEIVHLRSVVAEMQRRKIDAAKEIFQENLVNAFAAIKVPMKDGIETVLAVKKDEHLKDFKKTTESIDLEVVYRDEVYEKLEEFGDRELEAKRRENLLAIQSKDVEEKSLLTKAAEKFRELFEKKLTAYKAETSSRQLKQDFESYQRELIEDFLKSTQSLDWNREFAEQEEQKLQRWSSSRLREKVEESEKDEQRKEEQKRREEELAAAKEREREQARLLRQAFEMQQEAHSPFPSYSSYTSPSTPSYQPPSSPSYSSTPRSSSTADLKFYKGGQFTPGGGRAPRSGCYMTPPSSSRTSSRSSSSSGGTKFYKGGQFLPGGGRAPKGGCRR